MDFEDLRDPSPDPNSLEMLDPDPYLDPDSMIRIHNTVISLGFTEKVTKFGALFSGRQRRSLFSKFGNIFVIL